MRPRILLTLVLLGAVAACSSPPGTGPNRPVAAVEVTPATASRTVGETVQLTAVLRDAEGEVLTGRSVTWSSSAGTVASVSSTGLVTTVAEGETVITATSESRSATATITVTAAPVASIVIAPLAGSLVPGQNTQLAVTLRTAAGVIVEGRPVAWISLNPASLSVDAGGMVTAVATGIGEIRATSGTATSTISITVVEGGVVGVAGGTITTSNSSVMLVVPPGALTAQVALRIEAANGLPLDPQAVTASEIRIEPAATVFTVPATLELMFDGALGPQGVASTSLGIRRLEGGAWTVNLPQLARVNPQVASAGITQGGTYGVGRIPPATACAAVEARQFDFWLGSWDVRPEGQPDARAASSVITPEAGGCAVLEEFVDLTYIGRSINVFDPGTSQWYQTYVDTNGERLIFGGTLVGGEMILTTPNQQRRITWSSLDGGRVRQRGTLSTDGGVTFGTEEFNLVYTPR